MQKAELGSREHLSLLKPLEQVPPSFFHHFSSLSLSFPVERWVTAPIHSRKSHRHHG